MWNQSSKDLKDMLELMASEYSRLENHSTIKIYLSSLTERNKLSSCLRGLEDALLSDAAQCQQTQSLELLHFVHKKHQNIWFIWSHLDSGASPAHIHDKLLPEAAELNPTKKLRALYRMGHLTEIKDILRQALRTGFPLVTQDSIHGLLRTILEEDVFIEDSHHFTMFVSMCLGAHCPDNIAYFEKIKAFLPEHSASWELPSADANSEAICKWFLQASQQLWLSSGYPHGHELIYEALIATPHVFASEQQHNFLQTRLYSFCLYNLNMITLSWPSFQAMKIPEITHIVLEQNSLHLLSHMHSLYEEAKKLMRGVLCQRDFGVELAEYIFSARCTFEMCLFVLQSTEYVDLSSTLHQNLLIDKIQATRFDTFLESEKLLVELLGKTGLLFNRQPVEAGVLKEMGEVARVLSSLGVNEKIMLLWDFYWPDESIHPDLFLQERALYLLKNFISKFFIAPRKNKIVIDAEVEVGRPCSILETVHWLHRRVFFKGCRDLQQLHQIVFQLMLSFYRYEDAQAILSDPAAIKKYAIDTEKIQMVVIENINKLLQKEQINKVASDIHEQLKMLKKNNVEAQAIRATYRLLLTLGENGVHPPSSQKQRIDIELLYWIIERHPQCLEVLNFDELYEDVRAINSSSLILEDEKFLMTNELLLFKSRLAGKAYILGKKKLGNELIDEISRFNPPWLATELISIFRVTKAKMDKRIYAIALNNCAKGADLAYLMELWKKEGEKNSKDRFQFKGYFETGREYLVIDGTVVQDEERYRNFVAEIKFSDETMATRAFELFFILLGTEPTRAFQYALKAAIDPLKVDIMLREGMKLDIFEHYAVSAHLLKFLHFCNRQNVGFSEYAQFQLRFEDVERTMKELSAAMDRTVADELYCKAAVAFQIGQILPASFITTYFSSSKSKSSITYEILFSEQRKNILLDLREEPMGRTDIFRLNRVCHEILTVNLVDLCIFSLSSTLNKAESLSEGSEHLLQKIITLTSENGEGAREVLEKLTEKIFSVKMLVKVLQFVQDRENPLYREILTARHMQILRSLAAVEEAHQFHGLIPPKFLLTKLSYNPKWPLSLKHAAILKQCSTQQNIFVLSKVLNFFYGMNTNIEKKVLEEFMKEHPEEDLQGLSLKLQQSL